MKLKNIFKVGALAVVLAATNACVDNNDYSLPTIEITEPNVTVNSSIKKIEEAFAALPSGATVLDFKNVNNGGELVIEGYVVSSDEAGNIYKTISIQDKPENPKYAIQIAVDATDLNTFYNVGRKVYVKLLGLGMHDNRGVLEIGQINGSEVGRISSTSYKKHILRSTEEAEIKPLELNSISDITEANISMLVKFNNMQADNKGGTYANVDDTFNVNRIFESCVDGETIIMRNSGFADFKASLIPDFKGSITAVLGRYNSDFQLFIRSTTDIDFTENRCDPLFEESFEEEAIGSVNIADWTNYIEAGTRDWEVFSDANSLGNSVRIGSYKSNDASTIAWLITPEFDFDAQDGEKFSFKSSNSFSDGSELEVLFSQDWDGTDAGITTATWTVLPATIVPDTEYYKNWVDSGDVDMSSYTGKGYIAFKYTGSGSSGNDGTFEIDDIAISVD